LLFLSSQKIEKRNIRICERNLKEDIREVCRRFKKNQTKAEKVFWKVARNRQIEGQY